MTKEKVFISEADQYLFAQGTHYDIYKKLGAHLSVEDGVQGVYFGVWAPNAAQVNVIGTFNEWNEESHPMQKLGEGGIWGLFIPGVEEGTMYKFLIYARDGRKLYKADPFANYAEYRPGTASVYRLSRYFSIHISLTFLTCEHLPEVSIYRLTFLFSDIVNGCI